MRWVRRGHFGSRIRSRFRQTGTGRVALAMLYRVRYGFGLGALHAGGLKGARGLEGVESGGSHDGHCNAGRRGCVIEIAAQTRSFRQRGALATFRR